LAEASAESRLAALRRRWEEDKASPVFLPLAEEYRRVGRLSDALAVLEAGLQAQPNYLSALVALGRCRLEAGSLEAAVTALERVLAQDPTQLVANKLLVEAYLRIPDGDKAQARLHLYALLNDRDPEIVTLQRRIDVLGSAPQPAAPPPPSPPPAEPKPAERGRAEIFRLESAAIGLPDLSRRRAAGPRVPPAAVPPVPAGALPLAPAEPPAPPPPPASAAPPPIAPVAEAEPVAAGRGAGGRLRDPFPSLHAAAARRRYEAAFAAAGIFALRAASAPPGGGSLRGAPSAVARVAPVAPLAVAPPPIAAASAGPPAAAAPPPPEPAPVEATATLGELYLRQGHGADAEEIFRAVLQREPGEARALQGLEELRRRRPPPAPPEPREPQASPPGLTARRIDRLNRYMTRLRRAAESDVP
jgi:tetratricopeptide (TPR) repeat protein